VQALTSLQQAEPLVPIQQSASRAPIWSGDKIVFVIVCAARISTADGDGGARECSRAAEVRKGNPASCAAQFLSLSKMMRTRAVMMKN
jgi:hypothetical protein